MGINDRDISNQAIEVSINVSFFPPVEQKIEHQFLRDLKEIFKLINAKSLYTYSLSVSGVLSSCKNNYYKNYIKTMHVNRLLKAIQMP